MRRHILSVLLAGSAAVASPVLAQDHANHHAMDHSQHAKGEPDHSEHGATDHSQHEPAEESQVDHAAMDHSQMDHSPMDHSQTDHSKMDHSKMGHSKMDHSQMDHGNSASISIPSGPPPARAFEGPQHAADQIFDPSSMASARAYNHRMHGAMATGMVLGERLEVRVIDGEDAWLWDVSGWYGTATDKVVFKSEGEGEVSGGIEDAEVQLLWGHAIGPFVDLQAGVRVDLEPETRSHLVVGAAGLAPYMIHFDAALFLSDRGDLTGRIEAEHDVKLTQRLILQPRMEIDFALQDIPERGVGAGVPEIAVGARLRYEIVREFAPYLGVEYEAATGRTADLIRAAGGDPDGFAIVAGVRFWF